MRRREGPSKRLAPSTGLEVFCPHNFVEDEAIQLEIDCIDCSGAHDLSNARCMAGVMSVVCGSAQPETIILKRFTHKRYRKDSVRLISLAAGELAALNRALATPDTPSDKGCRTCNASRSRVIAELRGRLLVDPRAYMLSWPVFIDEVVRGRASIKCVRARECTESGLSVSTMRSECVP